MTFNEFRHWLRGFSAGFTDGVPDAGQWASVQAELAKVQPEFLTLPAPSPVPLPSIPMGPVLPDTVPWGPLPVTCTTANLRVPEDPSVQCWN